MKRSLKNVISDGMKLFIKDIKSAKWVIIAIITYFVFLRKLIMGFCPAVRILGVPCPSCGLTRAGMKVLHLDFKGAWEMHPFIYGIILLVILFVWNRYICLRKDMKWLQFLAVIVLCGMCVFYIYRMIRYFPGEPPMSYYDGNLLKQIKEFLL